MNPITNPVKNIVCDDWKGRISGNESTLQLLNLFVNNIQVQEYCFEKNYPSIELLEQVKEAALFFNVLINQVHTLVNPLKAFAFGDSILKVVTSGYQVCKITATHKALIHVNATGHSIVTVELYGLATCIYDTSDSAKVNLIKK